MPRRRATWRATLPPYGVARTLEPPTRIRSGTLPVTLVAGVVGIAFADSSIVVLALPQLYGRFDASIEGVSWVLTAYNLAVAVTAIALVLVVHRLSARRVLAAGLVLFAGASVACSAADSLGFLIGARCVQGAGGALLLAGALPVLVALTGSAAAGAATWTLAGTFGAALGPALGGVLTEAFDWRAIFVVQAPVAAAALLPARVAPPVTLEEGWRPSLRRTIPANVCIGLLFGALVGVLFLAVLLVIVVWGYSPIGGAAIVSVLPAATLAVRPLERRLSPLQAVCGGALLLAIGLVALALIPSSSVGYVLAALAFCGAGLGLSVPFLSHAALDTRSDLSRTGTLTIGVRHLGLVLALGLIAPLLASTLPSAGHRAELRATSVLLDAPISLRTKLEVAYDLVRLFDQAREGAVPDLAQPFDAHGARDDPTLAAVRDSLVGTIEETITRSFRSAFLLSALLAALAIPVALLFRGRVGA
jgi:predicted MFS family arabinose efflux permease